MTCKSAHQQMPYGCTEPLVASTSVLTWRMPGSGGLLVSCSIVFYPSPLPSLVSLSILLCLCVLVAWISTLASTNEGCLIISPFLGWQQPVVHSLLLTLSFYLEARVYTSEDRPSLEYMTFGHRNANLSCVHKDEKGKNQKVAFAALNKTEQVLNQKGWIHTSLHIIRTKH